jgi:hypothetical protein
MAPYNFLATNPNHQINQLGAHDFPVHHDFPA